MAHYHVILVWGQSNASAGLANHAALPVDPIDSFIRFAWKNLDDRFNRPTQQPDGSLRPDAARVQAHTSNGWRTLQKILPLPGEDGWAEERLLQNEPFYNDYARTLGYGVEMVIARRWAKEVHPNVAVIKHAIPSTALATGGFAWHGAVPNRGAVFVDAVERTRARLQDLTDEGHTYRIVLMTWQQGEGDSGVTTTRRLEGLRRLFLNARAEFGENFPILIGRTIGTDGVLEADEIIVTDRNIYSVEARDLPRPDFDQLHMWSDAYVTLGNRMFDEIRAR